jgi:predicted glycosyltransferase
MARRILLYSHDTMGLGHIRRVSEIGRKLATDAPDDTVLILTGSTITSSLRLPPNVDCVKLPAVRKINNSSYASRHLRVDSADLMKLRAQLIRETFEHFAPDILLVDKAPVGVHEELRPTLELAQTRYPDCQVVLSLRDILDEPAEVIASWEREGIHDVIRRYYDLVLVWGEQRVFDVVREYRLPIDIAAKVHYCGYIGADGPAPEAPRPRKRKKLVLVTVGGGEDGFRLLDSYLKCLPLVGRRFASVVLTGPDLPAEQREAIHERIALHDSPIFAVDYSSRVDRLMRAADLVVAMAGYNTMCEIVSRGRPAIVVPRVQPRQEQLMRARRWEALGLLRMIHPVDLTPEALAGAVDEELSRPKASRVPTLDFGGLGRAAEILRPDFHAKAGRDASEAAS